MALSIGAYCAFEIILTLECVGCLHSCKSRHVINNKEISIALIRRKKFAVEKIHASKAIKSTDLHAKIVLVCNDDEMKKSE